MFAQPQSEHHWLDSFVGDWTFEGECLMGPDQPAQKNTGKLSFRSLGGLWIVGDGEAGEPDGEDYHRSVMTIGFDPVKGRFVGSFVATMMTHFWLYDGHLDEAGRKLTLEATGPRFDDQGMTKYHDIIEKNDDGTWKLSSQIYLDDGTWMPFMWATYKKA